MSKLSLLRNAIKSRVPSTSISLRMLPSRAVSTESEPSTESGPTIDPFLQPPKEGLVFARLSGITKNTLKTDVIHFFEGCNLSLDDIKVVYNRSYNPAGMVLQFPSGSSFGIAVRQTIRKGGLYNLSKVDRAQWDEMTSYDGKAIIVQGIPHNASLEDVERFLCSLNYDPSTLQLFNRPGIVQSAKIAIARFPTKIDAMSAFLVKNRSFCLNNAVSVRVLQ